MTDKELEGLPEEVRHAFWWLDNDVYAAHQPEWKAIRAELLRLLKENVELRADRCKVANELAQLQKQYDNGAVWKHEFDRAHYELVRLAQENAELRARL